MKNRLNDTEFHNKQQEQVFFDCVSDENSLSSYVFQKISQLESQIQRYTTQISSLKDRLSVCEKKTVHVMLFHKFLLFLEKRNN